MKPKYFHIGERVTVTLNEEVFDATIVRIIGNQNKNILQTIYWVVPIDNSVVDGSIIYQTPSKNVDYTEGMKAVYEVEQLVDEERYEEAQQMVDKLWIKYHDCCDYHQLTLDIVGLQAQIDMILFLSEDHEAEIDESLDFDD